MKNTVKQILLTMLMASFVVPIFAQNALAIFFNDGNYSQFYLNDIVEISTSKYDENGVSHNDYQYQVVTTQSNKYYYDLSNIKCIAFSKYDEAKAEQNFVKAMSEVVNALSDCKTISDAETQIEQMKKCDGVEDAWSDGHQIYVKIEEGETFSFHFDHGTQVQNNWVESNDYQSLANSLLMKVKNSGASANSNLKVAIVDQQYKDESRVEDRKNFIEPLIKSLRDCGIRTDDITEPTVDFFYDNSSDPKNLHIYDYDIILLLTHGCYYQPKYLLSNNNDPEIGRYSFKSHAIVTSQEICSFPKKKRDNQNEKWKEYYSEFKTWKDGSKYKNISSAFIAFELIEETRDGKECWVGYPVLTDYFFQLIATGRFPDNSILFNTACQSLMGNHNFAEQLFKKNLSIYLGYTETNIFGRGIMPQFLQRFHKGMSLGQIYDNLPAPYKHETEDNIHNYSRFTEKEKRENIDEGPQGAEFKILPESEETRQRFYSPTITEVIDQTEAQASFDNGGYVEVKGYTTSLDFKDISMGFLYGTDASLTSATNVEVKEDILKLSKLLDNGNGNVVFRAKLTNLEPNNTYYYRAYTHDGTYYNYFGDPKSFSIYEKLSLSANAITVSALTCSYVQITSGSGSYSIEKIEPEGVVTASIVDNNSIAIEALTAGTAVITVKDNKSGQTQTIEVTVTGGSEPQFYLTCPDDHHPHLIDLGLPSGTKWACCNVCDDPSKQSPTNYYSGYYAWGETQQKEYYHNSTYQYIDRGGDISGTKYDVAHVRWGGTWQMPTQGQFKELIDNCTYNGIGEKGVYGAQFTGKNGGTILLPFAGHRTWNHTTDAYTDGYYWTSTKDSSESYSAFYLNFFMSGNQLQSCNYYNGFSVRPVSK